MVLILGLACNHRQRDLFISCFYSLGNLVNSTTWCHLARLVYPVCPIFIVLMGMWVITGMSFRTILVQ